MKHPMFPINGRVQEFNGTLLVIGTGEENYREDFMQIAAHGWDELQAVNYPEGYIILAH